MALGDIPSRGRATRQRVAMPLPRAIILDPSDNGPGLARTLRRHGVPVSLLATPTYAWTTRTRGVDGRALGPLPEETEHWLAQLDQLAEEREGVLIPASDAACDLLVGNRGRISGALRSFESPHSGHATLMDKASLHELAARAGVRQPRVIPVRTRDQIDGALAQIGYPCLLKPALSHVWRRRFGDERVFVARDPASLSAVAAPALDAGFELLVCDYIPGPVRNVETAVIVRRRDGTLPLGYTKRKIYQHPELGAGTLHETCEARETFTLAKQLLEGADFVGLASVEAKRHGETGEPVLMEANVRLPQGFGLGDAAGLDASWRLYATLAGVPLGPQPPPRPGVRLLVATRELEALAELRKHPRVLLRRFASYRNVRDVSGLDLRDPRLMVSFAGHFARAGLRRGWRALFTRRGGPV
jgi:D-aspartate ligase